MFDERLDGHKGPFACALYSQEFYETDAARGCVRGVQLQMLRGSGPVATALGGYMKRLPWGRAHHREFARQFDGHNFGGIEVANEAVHTLVDGRRMWVVHGDYFDGVIQYAKWLAYVGDRLYEFILRVNTHFNSLRARMGLPYWSLSQYLKHKVKTAVNYVSDFEGAVASEARERGFQGVICGHIHRPEMRTIDGTLYCNDGDWVESLSALVEHMDGRLELVHWPSHMTAGSSAQLARQTA